MLIHAWIRNAMKVTVKTSTYFLQSIYYPTLSEATLGSYQTCVMELFAIRVSDEKLFTINAKRSIDKLS